MFVVTGATGTVGSLVVQKLLAAGVDVRAVSRKPPANRVEGLEWFTGDLDDPASLGGLCTDADGVFLVSSGPTIADQDRTVVTLAASAGVGRVVKLSALSVAHGGQDRISVWHRAGEQAVFDSGLNWSLLRANGFMSNALNWADSIKYTGAVYAPYADGRTALIDPDDIAGCGVTCLLKSGHSGQAYELSGPQALTVAEQVATIGAAIDRQPSYNEVTPAVARDGMIEHGMPADVADAVLGTLESATTDFAAVPSPQVAALLGRPPTTFAQWAQTHREAFSTS